MPLVLILAFAASLGLHAVVLFGTDLELSAEPASTPLMAELRPAPRPPPLATAAKPAPPKSATAVKPKKAARAKPARPASATPVVSVPGASPPLPEQNDASPAAAQEPPGPPAVPDETLEPAPTPAEAAAQEPAPVRLPPRGTIRYRVDRGDSNFEIGFAQHEWTIADGHYRLSSVAETTGLVWLFKSVRIEMESRGLMTAAGLQPLTFAVRRDGQPTRESAAFDWSAMTVRVADRAEQPLDEGAQDLLSFNYQLGYLTLPQGGGSLPIATGKKYEIYRLEVLGDEDLELPAGPMHTLHLRAPGTDAANSTELWLAYDYLLLPVKIRYVDAQGDSFVQLATKIEVGGEDGHDARRSDADPR